MSQPVIHTDAVQLDRSVGNAILYQNEVPFVTSTQIGNATTAVGTASTSLEQNVRNFSGHAELEGFKPSIIRALQIGNADGSLSDTNVQAATNAATLAANTYGDPTKKGPLDLV